LKTIPILYLATEQKDRDIRDECLKSGGDDCILKPLNIRELVLHAHQIINKAHMEQKSGSKRNDGTEVRSALLTEINKLNQINRNLEETAFIDKMTGICNRAQFEIKLREEFHHAIRYDTSMSLILINIDSFDRVNDHFGFDVGDYILIKIANVLQLHSRYSDTVCKLVGANFAVVLPRTDIQNGIFEAERLRVAIQQTEYIDNSLLEKSDKLKNVKHNETEITACMGVGSFPFDESVKNENDLVELTRKALNRAKTVGKNKTVSAKDVS
jgi:diguanylate cyclase (GGDEF)-like protein